MAGNKLVVKSRILEIIVLFKKEHSKFQFLFSIQKLVQVLGLDFADDRVYEWMEMQSNSSKQSINFACVLNL